MTALVDNAIAHTPAGGTVDLHTGIHDGQAEVVVTDTGIGFEPSTADALFTRSQHADHGARPRFGLGLALVSEIAHAHGGSVRADGTPGQGAGFTLRLPARIIAPPRRPSGDGRAEEPADEVGDRESGGPADDDPEHSAAGARVADARAQGAGETERQQDGGHGDRDPPRGRGQQDRDQRQDRADDEGQR